MNNEIKKTSLNESPDEGIIIKCNDYKENSKLLFILTERGLVSLEAKGANSIKSKNSSYTKVLTNISYNYQKHTLTTGKVLNNYSNIKCNLDRYEEAAKILEMSYTLAEHITDFKIFYGFVKDCLEGINTSEYYKYYDYVFRTKLLYLLGVAPVLNRCVNCEKEELIMGFSIEDGGMVCFNCVKDMNRLYKDKFIEIFKYLYLSKLDHIDFEKIINNYSEEEFANFNKFLDKYYEMYMGYISKSRKIFQVIK